jgi:hypothetical protein
MVNGKKPKAVGVGSSTGIVRKVDQCPIPNDCEDKDPQEYKKWGTHKLPIKKHSDLNEIIDILIESDVYQLTLHKEKRKDLPSTLIPSLKNYEVGEFQVYYQGEKAKKTRAETAAKRSQPLETHVWRYTQWEYEKELDTQNFTDEEKEEYERKYWHTEEQTDTWTGDGNRTIWFTSTTPINKGERVYVKGKLMGETNYTVDRANGKIEFAEPPPELAEIRAHYLVIEVKPEHPTRGAKLEESQELVQQDSGEGNENVKNFTISVKPIKKNSETVYVKEKLLIRGIDYTIDPAKGEVTFTKPQRSEDIKIIYSDTSQAYKTVDKNDFETSRRKALDRLKWFSDVVKPSDPAMYEEKFKDKIESMRDWIEKWDVPFPSRELKDDMVFRLRKVEFNLLCAACKTTWKRKVEHPPSLEGENRVECPNPSCPNPKAEFEVTNLKQIYDLEDTILLLEMNPELQNNMKNELKETLNVEPFAIFFKVDEPKPGNPTAETEQQVLSDPKKFEEVANNLAEQLRKIKNEGAKAQVTFWGYADTSAGCKYNEDLSFRRVEWVKDKMERKLKTENIELPAINWQFGCGRGLADRRKKSGGYKADAHRAVIIELDNL